MGLNHKDDLFMLQIRLFRLAQIRWDKTAEECERIFVENAINDYIQTCYEEFHTQGDDANLDDIEGYLKRKELSMVASKYEFAMQLLAGMVSENIARKQKISKNKAFFKLMRSKTGEMLFDDSLDLWMSGPDYIADEYRRELQAKRKKHSAC